MKNLCRATALLVLFAPIVGFAADDKDHPELDKKTAEVLKKVGPLYKDAKSLRTECVVESTVTPEEGDKQESKIKVNIEFKRPNMFAMRTKVEKDEKAGHEVVCDGKTFVLLDRKAKRYTEGKSPKELDKVGLALQRVRQDRIGMLFQNVLLEDPAEALLEGVTDGKHVGMEKVGDKECHHMKFKQPGMDWELWVAAEGEPWILKALTDLSGRGGKLHVVETYSNWKMNADPTKDVFVFKAPEDAKKVKAGSSDDDDGSDK